MTRVYQSKDTAPASKRNRSYFCSVCRYTPFFGVLASTQLHIYVGSHATRVPAGRAGHVNYDTVPSIVYTWPELAWVGKTEDECKAAGLSYAVGKFNFMANSRARTVNDADGMVKFISDKTTDKILGCHILGPSAGELI